MWTIDHPSAPVRKGETASSLGRDFRARQQSQRVRLSTRSRLRRFKFAVFGAVLGVAAVFALCTLEGQPFHWYSPVWEGVLLAAAGYALGALRGGFLHGVGLFGVGYMGAIFLRGLGHDSSLVLGHASAARVVSLHGDFAAMLALAVFGGLIGFVSDRR